MNLFQERLRKIFQGRNGPDGFGRFILLLSVLLSLIQIFYKSRVFYVLSWLLFIYVFFRMFSKNIWKRQKENQQFYQWFSPVIQKYTLWIQKIKNRRTYRYLKCPKCKQEIRVPKGKGKIRIHCPKCKEIFESKS
ncbi:hypothetical protein HMPREF1987_02174 [Peptostreptococcaceae bacterium oral taxon 113 str. W5053]|nr:hypothetical protein HMPREF1987_02174 [Peptostreptococcaceae bacterium oral taxon 113 str. W5053]